MVSAAETLIRTVVTKDMTKISGFNRGCRRDDGTPHLFHRFIRFERL
jgi:hypothetical protein